MDNASMAEGAIDLESAFDGAEVFAPQRSSAGVEFRQRALAWMRENLGAASPDRLMKLAILFAIQRRLVFPGSTSQGLAKAQVQVPPNTERLSLATGGRRGKRIAVLFGKALSRGGEPLSDNEVRRRHTMLFFCGNDMHLSETLGILDLMRREVGVNVLIPEFLGFGLSQGRASEQGCYRTADAGWNYLQRRTDIDRAKIVATGVSLGGGVAIDLAARLPVAALITLVTFTSIPDMARYLFPDVPIWRFIRHRFESERKISRVTCPALIGHSTGDRLIPSEMADRLAAAAGGRVERFDIEGAGHRSAELLACGKGKIVASLSRFLANL